MSIGAADANASTVAVRGFTPHEPPNVIATGTVEPVRPTSGLASRCRVSTSLELRRAPLKERPNTLLVVPAVLDPAPYCLNPLEPFGG